MIDDYGPGAENGPTDGDIGLSWPKQRKRQAHYSSARWNSVDRYRKKSLYYILREKQVSFFSVDLLLST